MNLLRPGRVWGGKVRLGRARWGTVWHCKARFLMKGGIKDFFEAWSGPARCGEVGSGGVGHGMVWQCKARIF